MGVVNGCGTARQRSLRAGQPARGRAGPTTGRERPARPSLHGMRVAPRGCQQVRGRVPYGREAVPSGPDARRAAGRPARPQPGDTCFGHPADITTSPQWLFPRSGPRRTPLSYDLVFCVPKGASTRFIRPNALTVFTLGHRKATPRFRRGDNPSVAHRDGACIPSLRTQTPCVGEKLTSLSTTGSRPPPPAPSVSDTGTPTRWVSAGFGNGMAERRPARTPWRAPGPGTDPAHGGSHRRSWSSRVRGRTPTSSRRYRKPPRAPSSPPRAANAPPVITRRLRCTRRRAAQRCPDGPSGRSAPRGGSPAGNRPWCGASRPRPPPA